MENIFFAKPESGVITIHDDGNPYVGSWCGAPPSTTTPPSPPSLGLCVLTEVQASGSLSLSPDPAIAGSEVIATVSGIPSSCDGKMIIFTLGRINIGSLGSCTVSNGKCSSSIGTPSLGRAYSAKIDLDDNGKVTRDDHFAEEIYS